MQPGPFSGDSKPTISPRRRLKLLVGTGAALGAGALLVAASDSWLLGGGGGGLAATPVGGQPRCPGVDLVQPKSALGPGGGGWAPEPALSPERSPKLRRYLGLKGRAPAVPTWVATNGSVSSTIRFYDTSPFSPSGRFLAVLRFPDGAEGKPVQVSPKKGDLAQPLPAAQVVVVDLFSGSESVVGSTRGWDAQTGAHLQWGPLATDETLFFNDVVQDQEGKGGYRAVGVKLDLATGHRKTLDCTIYQVGPVDGRWAVSPCLRRMGLTQRGYGVHVPGEQRPRNRRAEPGDGLYLTDLETGRCTLMVSFEAVAKAAGLDLRLPLYGFHAKFNRQQTKVMFVVRSRAVASSPSSRWPLGGWASSQPPRDHPDNANHVIVMDFPNATNLHRVVTWSYSHRGGSHPTWAPQGDEVVMNLQHPTNKDPWRVVACPVRPSDDDDDDDDDDGSLVTKNKAKRGVGVGRVAAAGGKGAGPPASSCGGPPPPPLAYTSSRDLDAPAACRYLGECGSGHPQGLSLPLDKASEKEKAAARAKGPGGDPGGCAGSVGAVSAGFAVPGAGVVGVGLVVTDAYPKECRVFKGLVQAGAVPLRLLRPPLGHRLGHHPDPSGPPRSPPSSEVELLQVMSTSTSEFGGLDSRDRDGMAWRCDLHPAFDQSNRWIAFNGRPDGQRRQVLIAYLGDGANLDKLLD